MNIVGFVWQLARPAVDDAAMSKQKNAKKARARVRSLNDRFPKGRPSTKGKVIVRSPRYDGGESDWPDAVFDTEEEAIAEIHRRIAIDLARGEKLLRYVGPPLPWELD